MSSGPFTPAFYETDPGNGSYVLACRLQPETLAASFAATANAGVSGPATAPGSATISQGRRTAGVNMRYVTVRWDGAAPAGYSGLTARIPVPDPAVFASWTLNSTGTYLSTAATVVGRTSETIK